MKFTSGAAALAAVMSLLAMASAAPSTSPSELYNGRPIRPTRPGRPEEFSGQ
ncbi:hypothetical protein IMZ48_28935 [Candidatus Bathyarchaeota archaeon]|nr:hypothetical protein [Candidatus Bathyarchaeota archaeon]